MACPSFTTIDYKDAELEKLDFRGLIEDKYKEKVRDELLKEGLFLDYITTDKKITDTDNLTRATNEEIINVRRKIILDDTI